MVYIYLTLSTKFRKIIIIIIKLVNDNNLKMFHSASNH